MISKRCSVERRDSEPPPPTSASTADGLKATARSRVRDRKNRLTSARVRGEEVADDSERKPSTRAKASRAVTRDGEKDDAGSYRDDAKRRRVRPIM